MDLLWVVPHARRRFGASGAVAAHILGSRWRS